MEPYPILDNQNFELNKKGIITPEQIRLYDEARHHNIRYGYYFILVFLVIIVVIFGVVSFILDFPFYFFWISIAGLGLLTFYIVKKRDYSKEYVASWDKEVQETTAILGKNRNFFSAERKKIFSFPEGSLPDQDNEYRVQVYKIYYVDDFVLSAKQVQDEKLFFDTHQKVLEWLYKFDSEAFDANMNGRIVKGQRKGILGRIIGYFLLFLWIGLGSFIILAIAYPKKGWRIILLIAVMILLFLGIRVLLGVLDLVRNKIFTYLGEVEGHIITGRTIRVYLHLTQVEGFFFRNLPVEINQQLAVLNGARYQIHYLKIIKKVISIKLISLPADA